MKNFIIVADGGAEISAEVLGEAYQTRFDAREKAEAVLAQLREDAPGYGFGDVVYEIREVDPRCECGEVHGDGGCGGMDAADPVRVRYVAPSDRGTAEAAGSCDGLWTTAVMARSCAEALVESDGEHVRIVEATGGAR